MKTTKTSKATTAKKSTGAEKKTETARMVSVVKNLKSLLPMVKDKKLANKVSKALTTKTTAVDVLETLLQEVIASGNPKPAVEAEVKTVKKPVVKKTTKAEEPVKKAPTKKTAEKPTAKKPVAKKTENKDEEPKVKSLKTTGDTVPAKAMYFPDSITKEIDGEKVKLRLAGNDEYTTIAEIAEATEAGKLIVIACYWTARHIKQYEYANTYMVAKAPKSFPNDLDLAQGVTISEMNKQFFAMSIYTEAMYMFFESELTPIEDTNPYNGEKFMIRVANGMEIAVYVAD